MDAVSAQELLIEEGKSGELIAAFQALQETTVDDGPKYTPKTCRELARAIACRSYGRALLELSYLFVIAAACDRRGGRFENFFWDSGPARASAFRGYVRACEPLPRGITADEAGVTVEAGGEAFLVTWGRMPFLSAMVEFLMSTIGYAAIDELTAPLREDVPPRDTITDAANAIGRALYDYLSEHLPSAHFQRKSRTLLDFLSARADGRIGPEDVDDDTILAFWAERSVGDGETSDYRTYQSVFAAAVELRRLLRFARDRHNLAGARSIGVDRQAGEIDPADIEDAVAEMQAADDPLATLSEAPYDAIKFLNGREAETASEVVLGRDIATAVARSVFRNAVFGRVQNRITNALRHNRLTGALLEDAPEKDYAGRLEDYIELAQRLDRTLLAVLHVLAMARRPEAIELVIALRPGLDLGPLGEDGADEPEWEDDGVVSIVATRAAERFFERAGARAGSGDALEALMAEARKAFRANARQGFAEAAIDDEEAVDLFADSVGTLLALRREVAAFLDHAGAVDWAPPFGEDREVFTRQFRILYGGQNDG